MIGNAEIAFGTYSLQHLIMLLLVIQLYNGSAYMVVTSFWVLFEEVCTSHVLMSNPTSYAVQKHALVVISHFSLCYITVISSSLCESGEA